MIAVTILGNNSAIPAHGRHPTAQVVQTRDHMFLVDCGEGTQMRMNEYKIRRNKINHIFISHLHGDHYFGLIGLLNTLSLNARTAPLHIYAHAALESIIQLPLTVVNATLSYPVIFHHLTQEEVLFEDEKTIVQCFAVNHRIECWGFLFKEKKNLRKLNKVAIRQYKVDPKYFDRLHAGEDIVDDSGRQISNKTLTLPGTPARSYAYCADTSYYEPICDKIKGVDLVYHEATYLSDLEEKAASRFHATAAQAAHIAKKAGAKKLIIGHFSSMYDSLDDFHTEVCYVFANTEIAEEGVCYFA